MSNDYFDSADYTALVRLTLARAEAVNPIFAAIVGGFDVLPSAAYLKEGRINFAVDTGTADHYIVDQNVRPGAYNNGLSVVYVATHTNTGACDINVKGSSGSLLGVKSIKRPDGTDPAAGDIPSGAVIILTYYGSTFQILAPISAAALAAQTAAAASAAAALVSEGNASSSAAASAVSAAAALVSQLAASVSATAAAGSAASALRVYLGALGGSGDAMTSSFALAAYVANLEVEFVAPGTNTTAATLNINGLGAIPVKDADGNALPAGAIISGRFYKGVFHTSGIIRLLEIDASQTTATTGTDTVARMTSLRVLQSITANAPAAGGAFTIKAASFNASAGVRYLCDCSNAAMTATMPASPANTDAPIGILKEGANALTLDFGSNKVRLPGGSTVTGTVTIDGYESVYFVFAYVGTNAAGTTLLWVF